MSETYLSIKNWAEDDRPREKLLQKGRQSLSDAELIAILIASGSKNESAVQLSQRILSAYQNNLNALAQLSINDLKKFKGIGEAKAITIIAALELGRRRKDAEMPQQPTIQSSKEAYELIAPKLIDLPHEEFWIVLLNRRNKLLKAECISRGGVAGTVADVRIILKTAVAHLASSMILAHNHPSGNLRPSNEDKNLTQKIQQASLLVDIKVVDHLIIGHDGYYSFADEGLL
ncbi:MAG: DNA repair protein RadC [Bacteroidetes bacterium]|nr:DNA repair protein RadC [Bacteroidota bacterium]